MGTYDAYDGFILKRICPQLQGLPFPLPCVAVFKPCVPSEAIVGINNAISVGKKLVGTI